MTEEIKKATRYTQAETAYTTLSETGGKACANCRWFSSEGGGYCTITENYPLDVLPTGMCNKHEPLPVALPVDEVAHEAAIEAVGNAITAAQQFQIANASLGERADHAIAELASIEDPKSEIRKKIFDVELANAKGILERIKDVFVKPDDSAFQVFKDSDGKQYWLARHTNMFEDRDKEILSSKAHESYVARVDLGFVDPPELWAYHTKGTKHGQADIVWEHSGFVFALGHFDDTPEGKHAFNAYQKEKGKIELSHGFTYPKWALKDGVYESYNTFEISTLPIGAASNPFTSFEEIDTMALSAKQAEWIKGKLGEPVLKRVQDAQEAAEKDGKILKAIDERYKDFVETVPTESIEAGSGEVIKTLLADLIAAQAASVEEIDGFKATIDTLKTERETEKAAVIVATKASDDKVAELSAQVKQLQAQLDARPRSASTSPETEVNKSTLPPEVTQSMVKRDDFWRAEIKETP